MGCGSSKAQPGIAPVANATGQQVAQVPMQPVNPVNPNQQQINVAPKH